MRTPAHNRAKTLLLSASAFAIIASSPGARADTTITSPSGSISVGSGNLTNNSTISVTGSFSSSVAAAIQSGATIGTFTNNGLIAINISNGVAIGVDVEGTTSVFSNTGTILAQGSLANAVGVEFARPIDVIANSGTILASPPSGQGVGIQVFSHAGNLTNSGTIGGVVGIVLASQLSVGGSVPTIAGIDTLMNLQGAVIASSGFGDNVAIKLTGGTIGSLVNNGSILGSSFGGAINLTSEYLYQLDSHTFSIVGSIPAIASISQLINGQSGTILGYQGISLNSGVIDTLTNSGTITGTASAGIIMSASLSPGAPFVGTLINAAGGVIAGGTHALKLSDGSIGTILNSGLIKATFGTGADLEAFTADRIINASGGGIIGGMQMGGVTIGTVANSGVIAGEVGGAGLEVYAATITHFENGSVVGGFFVPTITQIDNQLGGTISGHNSVRLDSGTLDTLSNAGLLAGAVYIGGEVNSGTAAVLGTVINSVTGTIVGTDNGLNINGRSTLGGVGNYGTIFGTYAGISVSELITNDPVYQTVTIGSITNAAGAVIAGSGTGLRLQTGTIGTVTNSGFIGGTGNSGYGMVVSGAAASGITHLGSIGTLLNDAGGTISAQNTGLVVDRSDIGTVANSGTIAGVNGAGIAVFGGPYFDTVGHSINVAGSISVLTNGTAARISGQNGLTAADATIGTLANDGMISGLGISISRGLNLVDTGIGTLSNRATGVISGFNTGIAAYAGSIGTLSNGGLISGNTSGLSFGNNYDTAWSAGVVDNHSGGTIRGGTVGALLTGGTVGTLHNAGLITGILSAGVVADVSPLLRYDTIASTFSTLVSGLTIGSLLNDAGGTIVGGSIGLESNARIVTLANAGTVIGTGYYSAGLVLDGTVISGTASAGSIGTLINSIGGTFAGGTAIRLVDSTIGTLVNRGLIGGGTVFSGAGISLTSDGAVGQSVASIGSLINTSTGTIQQNNGAIQLMGGTIGTLSNSGLIKGYYVALTGSLSGLAGTTQPRIDSLLNLAGGTITAMNALQFQGGAIGALVNDGLIGGNSSIASGTAIQLLSYGTVVGQIGTIANHSGGTINGGSGGLAIGGHETVGAIVNDGQILAGSASFGDTITYGGTALSVANGAVVTVIRNNAGATIAGGQGGGGVTIGTATVGTLVNGGSISGVGVSGYSYSSTYTVATLGTLSNLSGGTIGTYGAYSRAGVSVSGPAVVSSIANSGLIQGQVQGLAVGGGVSAQVPPTTIGAITNAGTILGVGVNTISPGYSSSGGLIVNSANVGTITNSGVISGAVGVLTSQSVNPYVSLPANGSIGTLTNQAGGSILGRGPTAAIEVGSSIGTLLNGGLIQDTVGTAAVGVDVLAARTGLLLNATGGMIAGIQAGIQVGGTMNTVALGSLANAGSIAAGAGGTGILLKGFASSLLGVSTIYGATVGSIDNSGVITADLVGVGGVGTIGSMANSGTIAAAGSGLQNFGTVRQVYYDLEFALRTDSMPRAGSIGTLTNSGLLSGGQSGIVNGQETVVEITHQTTVGPDFGQITTSTILTPLAPLASTIDMLANSGTIQGVAGIGIANAASTAFIGALNNEGMIRGGRTGVANLGTIGALSNGGTIAGTSADFGFYPTAVANRGTIGSILNQTSAVIVGTIGAAGTFARGTAITNGGTIGAIVNQAGATIAGVLGGLPDFHSGDAISNSGAIGTIANGGVIIGDIFVDGYFSDDGSYISGTIGLIDNHAGGTIRSAGTLLWIGGRVGTIINAGLIISDNNAGIGIATLGSLGSLVNRGTGTISSVSNNGTLGTLVNDGQISGGIGNGGFSTTTIQSTIGGLTNNGHISGIASWRPAPAAGVQNVNAFIGTLVNNGTIDGSGSYVFSAGFTVGNRGIDNIGGTIGTLVNNGRVSGSIGINNDIMVMDTADGTVTVVSTIGTLTNAGTIETDNIGLATSGVIGTLSNSGGISGGNTGLAVDSTMVTRNFTAAGTSTTAVIVGGRIGVLTNSGLISGTGFGIDVGIGTINTLMNLPGGSIGGTLGALTIASTGVLGTLVNQGVIAGNIINNSSRDLLIVGGSGDNFGLFTDLAGVGQSIVGATIVNTLSNVVLASGNVALAADVALGSHTLTNSGSATLRLDTIVNVAGNYAQSGSGVLLINVASTSIYGGLNVTGNAAISGGAIILNPTSGFTLVDGQTYTIVMAGDTTSTYAGYNLVAPGHILTTSTTVVGNQTDLIVNIGDASTGTVGSIGSGSTTTIGGGSSTTVDQVTGGTVNVTAGTPTLNTISSGTVSISGGQSTLNTIAGGSVNISGGSASVGQVSSGTVSLGAGATIAGTQTVNVSGGSVAVLGTVTAPVSVSGGDVSVGSGGVVNTSAPIQVSSGNLSVTSGGVIASDKPMQLSGGAVNVAGVIAAPIEVGNSTATLSISSGGIVTQSLTASAGTVNVGGTIAAPVTVSGAGATLSISSGGLVTQSLTASAGTVNVGGTIAAPVTVSGSGATLSISSGGLVTQALTASAGTVNVGGTIAAPVTVSGAGATLSISSGGLVTQALTASAGTVNVGGTIAAPVTVSGSGASVSISSGGLVTQSLTASAGTVNVGGTIAAPVTVSGAGATLSISSGGLVTQSLTASAGNVSVAGTVAAPVTVSGSGATLSIRSGGLVTQSLTASAGTVNVGGTIAAPVTVSGSGASVSIDSGGLVTQSLTASAGSVNVGGTIAAPVTVSGSGATLSISSGGLVTQSLTASAGTVNVGGTIAAPVTVSGSGATLSIGSGGLVTQSLTASAGNVSVAGTVAAPVTVSGSGATLSITSGGLVTQSLTASAGTVNVGGTIAAPVTVSGSGASVSIDSGGLVTQSLTASAGSVNVGGTIAAPVTVSGSGATLSISSGGLVTQALTASAGTVNVGGTIAAPVTVSGSGATLSISSGGLVTQSLTASAGSVNVGGTVTAPVTISGGNVSVASGGTIVSSQAVQVTGGSLSISGGVNAPVQVSGTTVSASQIASATAVMTVDASGTISQSVTVDGGKVAMNGTISGAVSIGDGGALRGSGVVTGSASVSGILAPGNSPGTLTFTKGLTQGAKSVLSIDIDGTGTGSGAGNYSRVLVTGGSYVIGSGAVLTPKLRGITGNASNTYTPGLGTDFTVVQAAGGVSGTFASVVQPASGLAEGTQFTALYATNAVDLFVTPTYGSLASLGASANQQALGRVVAGLNASAGSDLATVLKALYSLPSTAASLDALAQIGGSAHANIAAYSLTRGLAATQVLGQRLAAVRDGVSGGMQGTMQAQLVGRTLYTSMASGGEAAPADERGMAAGSAAEDGWHFWAQGLGAFSRVDSDGNAQGGHSNTGGGLFGGDRTVAPGVTLGLAGTLLQSTSGGSNETSSYGLSAYGNADLGDGLFVAGNAGYTYDRYDTARTMGFGGLSRTAFGHTTGDELGAGVTAGYRVRVSNLTLEPQAGIQWLRVGRNGFTETGAGALNLVLQDLDATALQSSVGARASGSWKTDGGTVITPTVRASWLHDFRDRALTSQAAFAGTTFAVTGPDTGANALGIGGGLTLQESDNLNLYANYDGTLRRHETDHVFTAGLRLSW
ncbi:hypothetical protein [Nitrospirillum iridis]|uniref:Uncharacterized protein YhjY with autotransporter beta-barrel domain n=1 Tax=Nitrospirillum iridis TaxID=765888 RepID=A0A7X0AW11_9PROT|nr:hypothetical protein [Nitrospirillum iridis]MBB6249714.1 uncharacterized protein YhjY with autotransporter beta-barrel domain [Nitrospirillum iridis]